MIYVDDHLPAHTHVLGNGSAKIAFGAEIAYVADNAGMSVRDLRRALRKVKEHRAVFVSAWRDIHG